MNPVRRSGDAAPKVRWRRLALATATVVGALVLASGTGAMAALPAPDAKNQPLPAAQPGTLEQCVDLIGFEFDSTKITSAQLVPAGTLTNAGTDIGEHCLVTGSMNERISPVDGQTYTIGFEMRLPTEWSGRYLYQATAARTVASPPRWARSGDRSKAACSWASPC